MASPMPGASILMTSAPSSRSRCDAYGPAITWLKSTTQSPVQGSAHVCLSIAVDPAVATARLCASARAWRKASQSIDTEALQRRGAAFGELVIAFEEARHVCRRRRGGDHAVFACRAPHRRSRRREARDSSACSQTATPSLRIARCAIAQASASDRSPMARAA